MLFSKYDLNKLTNKKSIVNQKKLAKWHINIGMEFISPCVGVW